MERGRVRDSGDADPARRENQLYEMELGRHSRSVVVSGGGPRAVRTRGSLGSEGVVTDPARMESKLPALAYASSKAAVIMLTIQYAKALEKMRVNVVEPGFTATDLNGRRGHQTVAEGAEIIVRMATIGADGPTGTFQDRSGTMPW